VQVLAQVLHYWTGVAVQSRKEEKKLQIQGKVL
jgi:hypothetical protein